jgi:hypothetical protein
MINEFDTFDIDTCRAEDPTMKEQCDAEDFYNIELSLWGNIGVAIGQTIVVHLMAFCVLSKVSKAFRS